MLPCAGLAQPDISIQWDRNKAVSISVPISKIGHYHKNPDSDQFFRVYARGQKIAIIGKCKMEDDQLVFTPYWSFTPGLTYQVKWKNKLISAIQVPEPAHTEPPTGRIYPDCDTLPANLLKLYLQFSKPMREDNIYQFIKVVKNEQDTVSIFLELQPALWNHDQTQLTLWLDPGRIKRDLSPNRALGKPLETGNNYMLMVSSNWRDKSGVPLAGTVKKRFFVSEDDRKKPDPHQWKVNAPSAGTREPLIIDFGEPMDYALSQEAIDIIFDKFPVRGTVTTGPCEKQWNFIPLEPWSTGTYSFIVESRMEDLAGNNLNRLFDKDLLSEDTYTENEGRDPIFGFEVRSISKSSD